MAATEESTDWLLTGQGVQGHRAATADAATTTQSTHCHVTTIKSTHCHATTIKSTHCYVITTNYTFHITTIISTPASNNKYSTNAQLTHTHTLKHFVGALPVEAWARLRPLG